MIVVLFGNAEQFILLLLVMRLATSYLPPEEMGWLSSITAATAFFALFLVNPVGMFINRLFQAWDSLWRDKYYLKLHWLYLLVVSVTAKRSWTRLRTKSITYHARGWEYHRLVGLSRIALELPATLRPTSLKLSNGLLIILKLRMNA